MKRVIALLLALMLCFSLSLTVLADEFVQSITDKGAPEIVPVKDPEGKDAIGEILDANGNVIGYLYEDCLLITPVSQAETSEKIPDDAEAMLLDVYNKLNNGSMTLPYEKYNKNLDPAKMVIKDLFDVTWLCEPQNVEDGESFDEEHPDHPKMVEPKGITIRLTFKLNVEKNTNVYCMSYKNNAWNPVVSCVNNGDGTVTAVFEDFCPVSFSVGSGTIQPSKPTGDASTPVLWIILMSVSVVALGAVLVMSRRKTA